MPTRPQTKFVKHLLGRKGYYSDDWKWLAIYSVKEAGKLIDKLVHEDRWSEWLEDFVSKLPPPTEKPRRQGWLNLPSPEPMLLDEATVPDALTQFKCWARQAYARGELTIEQLCELHDVRFGSPFKTE